MSSGRGIPEYRVPMSARSELSLLINRVECLLLPGKIDQIDYKAAYVRVKMKDDKDKGITTDWIRWAVSTAGRDRTWEPPSVGENVLVFSPTGNLNSGIVFGAFNTTEFRPLSDSPTIRRKSWRHPVEGQQTEEEEFNFFDFPFWELETKKDATHVWDYLPKKGEFRKEIGKKVLVHFTEEFLMWRIGNTQIVLKDGSFTMTIADNLDEMKRATEIRATPGVIEIHTDREASIRINRSEPPAEPGGQPVLARVETQVKGQTTFVVMQESIKGSVKGDACLSLTPGEAILETKQKRAKLALKEGVTSLCLDGVSMYLTPTAAVLGMPGSEIQMTPGNVIAAAGQFLYAVANAGASPGAGLPYTAAGAAPVPNVPKAIGPQKSKKRWEMKESEKGPYYPRTKKPKE